jgi:hypothetical protein
MEVYLTITIESVHENKGRDKMDHFTATRVILFLYALHCGLVVYGVLGNATMWS